MGKLVRLLPPNIVHAVPSSSLSDPAGKTKGRTPLFLVHESGVRPSWRKPSDCQSPFCTFPVYSVHSVGNSSTRLSRGVLADTIHFSSDRSASTAVSSIEAAARPAASPPPVNRLDTPGLPSRNRQDG